MALVERSDAPPSALSLALPLMCNVSDEALFDNISAAMKYPILKAVRPHDVPAVIVGGGPSAKDDLPKIRNFPVGTLFALNGAGLWLQSHGIVPNALILLDARAHNKKFITGLDPRVKLYLATQCHPDVFAAAEANGNPIVAWHAMNCEEGIEGVDETRSTVMIGFGTSIGIRALRLVHVLGFRTVHLFGYDSSFPGGEALHAYPQVENEADQRRSCSVGGRWFVSTPWMIRQANDFQTIATLLKLEGTHIHVHGDGLLPEIARQMNKVEAQDTRVHPTAKVHPNAFIGDDVEIGARTRVWQFASVIRGAVLGEDCNVAAGVCVDGAHFGDRCSISQGVALSPGFLFGNDVFIGPNVSICNDWWPSVSKENFDMSVFNGTQWAVIVKSGAAIGANSVILPGVMIGERALVAAGSVVNKDVPDDHLWQRDGTVIPICPPWRLYRMRFAGC